MNSVGLEKTLNGGWERGKSNNVADKPTKVKEKETGRTYMTSRDGTYNISYSKGNQTIISTFVIKLGNVVPRQ